MKHEWMTNNPPEEIYEYLVTDDCGCLQIATWTNEFYLGHKVIGNWHWERQQYTNVVAWMPLPHPYKPLNEVEQEIRAKAIEEFITAYKNLCEEKYGDVAEQEICDMEIVAEQLKAGAT